MSIVPSHEPLTSNGSIESAAQEVSFDTPGSIDTNLYPSEPASGAAPATAFESQLPEANSQSATEAQPSQQSSASESALGHDVTSENNSQKTGFFRTRTRKAAAIGTLVAVVGGGIGAAVTLGGSSSPRQETATNQSVSPSNTQSPNPNTTNSSSQKPSNSPISIPSVAETTPALNTTGNEQLKDPSELGPTTPEAVPYVEGQAFTSEDVQILVHNIEVASNTGDLNNLLYSGIYPDSELASNINTYFVQYYQNEKQQIGAMAGPFNIKVNANDVMIDPSGVAHVRMAIGTDFDFTYTSAAKPRVNYTEASFTVGNKTVTLPDGTSKNIVSMVGSMSSEPSTYQDWNSGF